MKKALRIALWGVLVVVVIAVAGPGAYMYRKMEAMKAPRYEAGAHRGAAFCGGCHPDEYRAWAGRSRHALATTSATVLDFQHKIAENRMLNLMVGERMCLACHGQAGSNEGVNCEICHGPVPPGMDIMEVHRTRFAPGLARMRDPAFCGKCHDMAGSEVMATYREWRASPAAARGITCQGCHMPRTEGGRAHHGFDTAVRVPGLYDGDLAVEDVRVAFPELRLVVENRVTGHSIPAGGPTRHLVLSVQLLGEDGAPLFDAVRTFGKKSLLIAGMMPMAVTDNTQLRAGERREVAFVLPEGISGRALRAVITLRFYEVSDEYNGDLDKAHWISEPVLRREVALTPGAA